MLAAAPPTEAPGQQVAGRKRFPRLLRMFEPAPPAAVMVTDPELIKAQSRYWQRRVMIATIVGYATYYFVRKNLSIAMPVMEQSRASPRLTWGCF